MTSNTHADPASPSSARGRRGRLARALGAALAACALMSAWPGPAGPAAAAKAGLHIELNKLEDGGGSCLASFVVRNDLGHTLDRFSLDLYVFDPQGVIIRQVLLDMAPLRQDKTTVARFALLQGSCERLGQVLVNDIPSCRSDTGQTLDCLAGLAVSSRSRVELVK